MRCPFCTGDETRVVDSRLAGEGAQVRRRRECSLCKERFTTYESPELTLPRVIKQARAGETPRPRGPHRSHAKPRGAAADCLR